VEGTTSFGAWLRRRRKALDLTQEELANRVGCSVGTIRMIEADERRPSRQIAERLADQLEVAPSERPMFIKAARAELGAEHHGLPVQPVEQALIAGAAAHPPAPPDAAQRVLPRGTVTFLFTDIEGSTTLWERHGAAMQDVLARHNAVLRTAIEAHGGMIFKHVGDAVHAAFATAPDALAAALAAQRALHKEDWGLPDSLRVRMALHTGTVEIHDDDYLGPSLNRLARLLSAAHGGQTLLSLAAQELVRDHLPLGVGLRDLGLHRLKDLIRPEHIFQLVTPDLLADFPPLKTLDYHPTNLPVQPTSLIGRERELAAACAALRQLDVRLLTLTGAAGTGKTRLGLQMAAELIDDFADGVFFVSLTPIRDPELVMPAIAHPLDVKEMGGQSLSESLRHHLHDKQLLLMLDNFEQVAAAAPLVADLLATCPHLKILITSREALHLRGEQEFPVPPLALPDPRHLPSIERLTQYEALRLFIERAQAVKPDFQVTNVTAPAVAEICARLDGLPLAIELAAARIKLFPPQALLARLNRRLALLTGGPRDLPARQQTLRNTIDWSYDLLNPDEQTLFARLAVFMGGRTLEAAEAVCNAASDLGLAVLDGLASLVDKHLVYRDEGSNGEPRFMMLETIWEYALERLEARGEAAELQHQHASYYLALAEGAVAHLSGPQQDVWLERLEVEHDNLRAALAWAFEGEQAETLVRFGAALWRFWEMRGHFTEGRTWLERVLEKSRGTAVALRAQAFTGAGTIAWHQGDYARAIEFHEAALRLYRELGDKHGIAFTLNNLGAQALVQGDYAQAAPLFEEGLAIARELGDRRLNAYMVHNLAEVARHQGDYTRAAPLYAESLALVQELGDRWGIAINLAWLGTVTRYQGNYAHATALLMEGLTLCQALGDKERIAECLEGLAGLAGAQEQAERAAHLFGAAAALRDTIDAPLPPAERADYERDLATIRSQIDAAAFADAWAAGQAMPPEQAIAEALNAGSGGESGAAELGRP